MTEIIVKVYDSVEMEIETDGDGDSAYISVLGLEYFKGINGHIVK